MVRLEQLIFNHLLTSFMVVLEYWIKEFGVQKNMKDFLNEFIKYSMINDIRKRLRVNQQSGSS